MLNALVEALGSLVMTVLIFIGVVIAGLVGVLIFLFWSVIQFIVVGALAILGITVVIYECFTGKR